MRWNIGEVTVTLVRERLQQVPGVGMLPDFDPAVAEAHKAWLQPHFVDEDGNLLLSIHALVLESEGQKILVDTCIGNRPVPGFDLLSHLGDQFLEDLVAAGHPPETVDTVLCTHLHFDHVGWNTRFRDGRWVPTFPAARYLFGRIEYDYWDAGHEGAAITFADAVRPVFDAGLADLVEVDHRITGEVWLEPTPGHTPGHVSVRISSGGHDAVVTGDLAHHPIQFVAPEWAMDADDDPALASETRAAFRDRYADGPVTVFGTHFGGPSCGHIRRDGGSFRFDALSG